MLSNIINYFFGDYQYIETKPTYIERRTNDYDASEIKDRIDRIYNELLYEFDISNDFEHTNVLLEAGTYLLHNIVKVGDHMSHFLSQIYNSNPYPVYYKIKAYGYEEIFCVEPNSTVLPLYNVAVLPLFYTYYTSIEIEIIPQNINIYAPLNLCISFDKKYKDKNVEFYSIHDRNNNILPKLAYKNPYNNKYYYIAHGIYNRFNCNEKLYDNTILINKL